MHEIKDRGFKFQFIVNKTELMCVMSSGQQQQLSKDHESKLVVSAANVSAVVPTAAIADNQTNQTVASASLDMPQGR